MQEHEKLPHGRGSSRLNRRLVVGHGIAVGHEAVRDGHPHVGRLVRLCEHDKVGSLVKVLVDELEKVLGRVGVERALEPDRRKVAVCLCARPKVHGLAGTEDPDVGKHVVHDRRRLMDRANDRPALGAEPRNALHDVKRRGRVEPGRGFVQEQDRGIGQQFDRDREPPLLAAREALAENIAHDRVLARAQPHFLDRGLDPPLDRIVRDGRGERHLGCHPERLEHGKRPQERVFLRDIACDRAKASNRCRRRTRLAIDLDRADDRSRADAVSQEIEQCRLARARGAHDRTEIAGADAARDVAQNRLVAHHGVREI